MSILHNLKRALGFDSDDEIFLDDEATADEPDSTLSLPAPSDPAPDQEPVEAVETMTDADAIAADMLASVVELFNSFQPEFIASCLDEERQRRLLTERLTPALHQRLAAIAEEERNRVTRESARERAGIDEDLKRMRERNIELEKRREAFKDEQLSATRQKRALQERVHDLEAQTEQLAAEKEQLELENRSMANKLRVAGVSGAITAAPDDAQQQREQELLAQIERLTADNGALSGKIRDAEATVAEMDSLKEQLAAMTASHDDALRQLSETELELARLQDAASQAEKMAILADKKEARIAELKTRLKESEENLKTIARLEEENKTLRSTIESNLYEHANAMTALRREMEESMKPAPRRGRPRKNRQEAPDNSTPAAEKKPDKQPRRKAQPHISAIDELIEGSEWLVAPTPEEVKLPMVEEPSDDFGYKAPARKPTPHDDSNQLTLF